MVLPIVYGQRRRSATPELSLMHWFDSVVSILSQRLCNAYQTPSPRQRERSVEPAYMPIASAAKRHGWFDAWVRVRRRGVAATVFREEMRLLFAGMTKTWTGW